MRLANPTFIASVCNDSPTWSRLQLRTQRGRVLLFGFACRRCHPCLEGADSGPSADRRSNNAVEVVPVLLETGGEARGSSPKIPGLFEELPGRCLLTLVASGV